MRRPQRTTTRIPFGFGVLTLRRRIWWMRFHDADGIYRQESTHQTDYEAAERVLAREAVKRADADLRELRSRRRDLLEIAREAPSTGPGERAA
jgi:hypothetical protein